MASIDSEFTQERVALVRRLDAATNLRTVDNANHALIWLSDLEVLREMVENAESSKTTARLVRRGFRNTPDVLKHLKSWLARRTGKQDADRAADLAEHAPPSAPAPAPAPVSAESSKSPQTKSPKRKGKKGESPSPTKIPRLADNVIGRSKPARDTVQARDNDRCVVTKMGEPIQMCHIYPYALGKKPENEREEFWSLLETFWAPDKIEKWKSKVLGPRGTETVENYLCLSTIVHDLWGKARLALEPVEVAEDGTSLTVRFWWLPGNKLVTNMPLCDPPCLPASLKGSPLNAKLWNCDTDQPIYSGQLVTLTTRDPVAMPLPSFELLNMQWMLNRIAALCGAADVSDEVLDDPDFWSRGEITSAVLEALPPTPTERPRVQLPERPRRPQLPESPDSQATSSENRPPLSPPLRRPRESSKVRELAAAEDTSDDPFVILGD